MLVPGGRLGFVKDLRRLQGVPTLHSQAQIWGPSGDGLGRRPNKSDPPQVFPTAPWPYLPPPTFFNSFLI